MGERGSTKTPPVIARILTESKDEVLGYLLELWGEKDLSPEQQVEVTLRIIGRLIVLTSTNSSTNTKSVIAPAPGSLVLKIAEFVCTKKVYDRVFFQVVDDMRREYFEALFSSRKEKARWVVIRGYLALAWHVTLQVSEFLVSGPAKIMKALWT